jgi:hypothetical protein
MEITAAQIGRTAEKTRIERFDRIFHREHWILVDSDLYPDARASLFQHEAARNCRKPGCCGQPQLSLVPISSSADSFSFRKLRAIVSQISIKERREKSFPNHAG